MVINYNTYISTRIKCTYYCKDNKLDEQGIFMFHLYDMCEPACFPCIVVMAPLAGNIMH